MRVLGDTSDALNWTTLITIAPQLNPNLLRLSFVFALAGYGTKMGLAPFHTWLPDAHSQAPSPISALLSGVSLISAFYALVRFHLVTAAGLGTAFSSNLLIFFGLLSIAVALPFLIRQEDVKRLLAYSSVEHMGVLALGLGFGGPIALLGVIAHVGLHALTKATLFISAGELVHQYGSRRLSAIRGTLTASPVAGGALGSGIVLLGGLPPSGIFVTEFAIIVGGVARGYVLAAALRGAGGPRQPNRVGPLGAGGRGPGDRLVDGLAVVTAAGCGCNPGSVDARPTDLGLGVRAGSDGGDRCLT